MTYNLSKQGKHLRKLTTTSRLGPPETRTKTLTVCILVVKPTSIIFCRNIKHLQIRIIACIFHMAECAIIDASTYLKNSGSKVECGYAFRQGAQNLQFRSPEHPDGRWAVIWVNP